MCLFCDIRDNKVESLRVDMPRDCFILIDKFPVSPGHILIVLNDHSEFISSIVDSKRNSIFYFASILSVELKNKNPKILGFNLIVNDGSYAGQHVPHVHIHLIPRYRNDGLRVLFNFFFSRFNPLNYFSYSKNKTSIYENVLEVSNDIESNLLQTERKLSQIDIGNCM